MIHFQCPHCAQKLTAPDGRAGKEDGCPRCKKRITIPPVSPALPSVLSEDLLAAPPADLTRTPALPTSESATVPSDALDRQLLDLPPAGRGSIPEARLSNEEVLAKLRFTPPPEYTGERRLPWPVDILLYPANSAGLMNLAIIVAIPVFLTVLQRVVFLPFLRLMFFLAELAIGLYAAWYWAECTDDSAKGGTRAPQLLDAASYGDKWSRVWHLLAVYAVFVLPLVLYAWRDDRNAIILGVLLAWAILFFPMGLLAMIINDGMYVLHPLFLLGSICHTWLPYGGLLLLMAALGVLLWLVLRLLTQGGNAILLAGPVLLAGGYLSLVVAHILGRFYWHYHERLNWEA